MALLNPPREVLDIAARLEGAGFEAWCVGGAVRDAILGHPHLDWDLATAATPPEIRRLFGRKSIPVGVEFGTVGVLDPTGRLHEVTTFRRDVKTDGRHAEVEFGASLEEDLARRDFTINAIAYSPKLDEMRDPFDGRGDIERRVLRAVGDADRRMEEDRLRALRALRFAARFDLAIEDATWGAIERSAPHLGRLSAERVKQEIDKTLEQVARPSGAFLNWKRSGAFTTLLPPLARVEDSLFAIVDHLAPPALERRPMRRQLRLAGLLSLIDPADVPGIMERLRASKAESSWVATVTLRLRSLAPAWERAGRPSDQELRRLVASIGRLHVGAVMRLAHAFASAVGDSNGPRAIRSVYRRMLRIAFRDPIELADLAVDGDDLRRAGIAPGPGLGKILQALLSAVIEDPARNRTDWLLQEAARLSTQ